VPVALCYSRGVERSSSCAKRVERLDDVTGLGRLDDAMGVGRDRERSNEAGEHSGACPFTFVLSGVRPGPALMGRGP
jgi:hypothetical protein